MIGAVASSKRNVPAWAREAAAAVVPTAAVLHLAGRRAPGRADYLLHVTLPATAVLCDGTVAEGEGSGLTMRIVRMEASALIDVAATHGMCPRCFGLARTWFGGAAA